MKEGAGLQQQQHHILLLSDTSCMHCDTQMHAEAFQAAAGDMCEEASRVSVNRR